MQLPFETYDVFTDTLCRGNPLAIVTIPAGAPKPTQEQKQAVAREFNLSETVFVRNTSDPGTETQRAIDIFLPSKEIAFAGHPIIGAAVSLLAEGVTDLVSKAGSVVAELDAPLVSIVRGVTFALVELPSLQVLARAQRPSLEPSTDDLLDEGWREGLLGRYYFVQTGTRAVEEDGVPVYSVRARMLLKEFEGPATGSAACALCAHFATTARKSGAPRLRFKVTQGVEMGRKSDITVEIGMQDSEIISVDLAGTAVKVMRGVIDVPELR